MKRLQARIDRRIGALVAALERVQAAADRPTAAPTAQSGADAFTVLAAAIGGAFEGLGKGLNSMVEASARQQEATGKILEMLMTQAAKRATSDRMSTLGRKGGLATQAQAHAPAVTRSQILKKASAFCEVCGAKLEGRKPASTKDVFRHARENHDAQLPALREALDAADGG